jgi:hypothetical protein
MFKRLLTITLLAFVVAFIGPAWSYDTAMAETVASDTGAPATVNPETPQLMPGKGMMHGGGRHGKGEGGMMQGCGQHGKGQGGMMHGGGRHGKGKGGMMQGGGQHGKGGHEKDRQVIQRLDMIEARMAKIEAMLETLVRR